MKELFNEAFVQRICRELLASSDLTGDQIHYEEYITDGEKNYDIYVRLTSSEAANDYCVIHTRDFYKNYCNGQSISEFIEKLLAEFSSIQSHGFAAITGSVSSYEEFQSRLMVRLLPLSQIMAPGSCDCVYRKLGDIALVLYLKLDESPETLTSAKIEQSLLKRWNLSEEDAFGMAMENSCHLFPPRILLFDKLFTVPDYHGECFMDPSDNFHLDKNCNVLCLSNTALLNGAVSIFLPGVARKISELFDDDLCLVFSSCHEIMIHPLHRVNLEDISVSAFQTIKETTPASDFLSYKIYFYRRESGIFGTIRFPDRKEPGQNSFDS